MNFSKVRFYYNKPSIRIKIENFHECTKHILKKKGQEAVLNQKWIIDEYEVRVYRSWCYLEIIIRLIILSFGQGFVGKAFEEKQKTSFSIYGKVVYCTPLLVDKYPFYFNLAMLFLMPNDEVYYNKVIITSKFLISTNLLSAIYVYEPPEIKCIYCRNTTHMNNQCVTIGVLRNLFDIAKRDSS
ncbi:hypothetical protein K502DRAFT_352802 [Neoconidiobolus thromboides FSU 785]|nr:hypothetical protein K502DRAFT_352802 [Neoconidiobolus thromboides FSU 785]